MLYDCSYELLVNDGTFGVVDELELRLEVLADDI